MPVIIQQGKTKMLAQPGAVIGINEEENKVIMKNQSETCLKNKEYLTLQLLQEDEELNDIMDELLTDPDTL